MNEIDGIPGDIKVLGWKVSEQESFFDISVVNI